MTEQIKDSLADYLDEQARWRLEKADEYPEDERNLVSANGLQDAAAYVRSLPPADERLQTIARYVDNPEAVGSSIGELAVDRYRYPGGTSKGIVPSSTTPEGLIEEIAEAVQRDAQNRAVEEAEAVLLDAEDTE